MMVLSLVVFLIAIGVLFYHQVNLYLSSAILLVYTAASLMYWMKWLPRRTTAFRALISCCLAT